MQISCSPVISALRQEELTQTSICPAPGLPLVSECPVPVPSLGSGGAAGCHWLSRRARG